MGGGSGGGRGNSVRHTRGGRESEREPTRRGAERTEASAGGRERTDGAV